MTKAIFKNRKEMIVAFKDTFGTPTGKKVLQQIGELCGKDLSSFSPDALSMAYKSARRDTYLEIQDLVNFEIVVNHRDKTADSDQNQSSADEEDVDPLN